MSYPYKATFFARYPEYIPPTSEEDALTDPREKLKPACKEKCAKYTKLYDECVERVRARNEKINNGELDAEPGHCLGQHYELVSCVDNCVCFKAKISLFRFPRTYFGT
ncbi:ubiquinol-cytochrome c reductase complex, subunit, putative [Theileria annulata]|uniref:Ubiquinol-cytochrome c reductase complex, subunit, putative n=1 Tax=Theileria annulata TaxID=5874 RepID=Q4U9W4_THEAN|nr:ubiquinol-cytochrome c reductase complex, subunit, putative [Theileria annulata]CAI76389.1 ubiquinol-cytochrome c reductase complex, subunit, putative [Theileria annulata]|eukprot:XP_953014.1 ubiquinol-cytochrome c reductase complex, subunit, putative [Theileria annulata]